MKEGGKSKGETGEEKEEGERGEGSKKREEGGALNRKGKEEQPHKKINNSKHSHQAPVLGTSLGVGCSQVVLSSTFIPK